MANYGGGQHQWQPQQQQHAGQHDPRGRYPVGPQMAPSPYQVSTQDGLVLMSYPDPVAPPPPARGQGIARGLFAFLAVSLAIACTILVIAPQNKRNASDPAAEANAAALAAPPSALAAANAPVIVPPVAPSQPPPAFESAPVASAAAATTPAASASAAKPSKKTAKTKASAAAPTVAKPIVAKPKE